MYACMFHWWFLDVLKGLQSFCLPGKQHEHDSSDTHRHFTHFCAWISPSFILPKKFPPFQLLCAQFTQLQDSWHGNTVWGTETAGLVEVLEDPTRPESQSVQNSNVFYWLWLVFLGNTSGVVQKKCISWAPYREWPSIPYTFKDTLKVHAWNFICISLFL